MAKSKVAKRAVPKRAVVKRAVVKQAKELAPPRDVGRLLRYGEKFGAQKIDVRWLPQQLPIASTAIALCDAATPKSWRVLERPMSPGSFRVMLSIVKDDQKERLAAVVVHCGRPPIASWTVAPSRNAVTSGWLAIVDAGTGSPGVIALPTETATQPIEVPLTDGRRALCVPCKPGEYAAYWAVDAADKPICLVVDFDVLTQKEWKAKPT